MEASRLVGPTKERVSDLGSASSNVSEDISCLANKSVSFAFDVDSSRARAAYGLMDLAGIIPLICKTDQNRKKIAKTASKVDKVALGVLTAEGSVSVVKTAADVSTTIIGVSGDTASKVAVVASDTLDKGSKVLKILSSALKVVAGSINIHKGVELQKRLKTAHETGDGISFFKELVKTRAEDLKSLCPDIFESIEDGKEITRKVVEQALKEIEKNIGISAFMITLGLVGIGLGIASFIVTSPFATAAVAVACFLITCTVLGIDINALVKKLKKSTSMSKKDLIIHIITIVVSLAALGASVALSPTLLIAILSGITGALMAGVPTASIIYLKEKEKQLAEKKEARRLEELKEQERLIAKAIQEVQDELKQREIRVLKGNSEYTFMNADRLK